MRSLPEDELFVQRAKISNQYILALQKIEIFFNVRFKDFTVRPSQENVDDINFLVSLIDTGSYDATGVFRLEWEFDFNLSKLKELIVSEKVIFPRIKMKERNARVSIFQNELVIGDLSTELVDVRIENEKEIINGDSNTPVLICNRIISKSDLFECTSLD